MSHSIVPNIDARLTLRTEGTNHKEELCATLKKTEFFSGLTDEEIDIVSNWINIYEARKGMVIFKEGEGNTWLCILATGKLVIFKEATSDKNKEIAVILPGMCIGEMSLIDDEPLSATVAATEECEVLLISKENFQKIIEQHPELGNKLLWKIASMLTSRLRNTTTQLAKRLG